MKRKLIYVAFLAALLVGGCMTPRQKAYTACESYQALALVLIEARTTGAIPSDEVWAELQRLDRVVYAALMKYVHVLQWGEAGSAERQAFLTALAELEEAYRRAPKAKGKPLPASGLPMMEV